MLNINNTILQLFQKRSINSALNYLLMSHSDPGSDPYRTRMIVRTNLEVPDILIAANDKFEETLKHVYSEVSDPESKFYVGTDYLLFRFL